MSTSTSTTTWSSEFVWDDGVGDGPTWEKVRSAYDNAFGGAKRLGPFVLRAGQAVGPGRLLVEFQGKRYGIKNAEPAIRSLLGQLRADVRRAADLAREAEEKRRGETTTLPPARDVQAERARAFRPFLRAFEV